MLEGFALERATPRCDGACDTRSRVLRRVQSFEPLFQHNEVVVFAEHIRTGWWVVPELAGVALVTAGTVHLSRSVPLTGELGG